MHVAVLGAGVAGVTTAHFLRDDGHDVTVVDRQPAAACETSYANAGLVAPGHAYAWASPKAPRILLRSLYKEGQALRLKPRLEPRMWAWGWRFLKECTAERNRINTRRKSRLCLYSQGYLHEVARATGVDYDGRRGLLYLYRSQEGLETAVANMRILQDNGQELEAIDGAAAARIDPALAPVKDRIVGAIHAPTDESGDCRKFTRGLAEHCAGRGVEFRYGTTVRRIVADGERVERVETDDGEVRADAYVLALGCYSPFLARPLGVRLPIYPVKGYSVTIPVAGHDNPPTLGGVDEQNLVAYAPLDGRVRITATAEFAGYDTSHRPRDFAAMLRAIGELFPEAGDYGQPDHWAGLRPMTPEGTPLFGTAGQRDLFYNTGHGHMGWTMACGAAKITADLIAGRRPEIDLEGMRVADLR